MPAGTVGPGTVKPQGTELVQKTDAVVAAEPVGLCLWWSLLADESQLRWVVLSASCGGGGTVDSG